MHAKLSLQASALGVDSMAPAPACYSSKMTTCKNLSAVLEKEAEEEAPTFTDSMNRRTDLHWDPMGVGIREAVCPTFNSIILVFMVCDPT